jgi:hypothetical protein
MSLTPQQPTPAMPAMPTLPTMQLPAVAAATPAPATNAKRTKEEIAAAILSPVPDVGLKEIVAKKKPWYAIFSSSASSKLVKASEAYKEFTAKKMRGEIGTGDKAAKAEQAAEEALVKTLEPIVQELAPEQQEAARQTLVDAARKHAIDEAKKDRIDLIDKESAKIVTKNTHLFKELANATGNAAETQKIKAILTAKVTEATKKIKGITPEEIQQEVAKITAVSPQQAEVIAKANQTQIEKLTEEAVSQTKAAVSNIPAQMIAEVKNTTLASAKSALPPGVGNLTGQLTGIKL